MKFSCAYTVVHMATAVLSSKGQITIQRADVASQAASLYTADKADLADCVVERTGHPNACDHPLTFDRVAVRHARMRLLER